MNWEMLNLFGKYADKYNLECYLVGGAIRDSLLGKQPKDYDFVCNDSEKMISVIEKEYTLINVKKFKKYGTYQFQLFNEDIEFVNPRKEAYMTWSHKPICKKGTIKEDIMRRDFTINTLALKMTESVSKRSQMIDMTKRGLNDFHSKRLDCVSDPFKTFKEDPSRLIRLCIYASKGFTPTDNVIKIASQLSSEIKRVPPDAIKQMMDKGIVEDKFLFWMYNLDILQHIIPEIKDLDTYEQPQQHHLHNVWKHTLKIVESIGKEFKTVRWAGLFHDLGKKVTWDERQNYLGHEYESEKIAKKTMLRLRFSNKEMKEILHLVRNHMKPMSVAIHSKPTKKSIGRFFRKHQDYIDSLYILVKADIRASGVHTKKDLIKINEFFDKVYELKANIGIVEEKEIIFKLNYTGNDIMKLFNISPSPLVGKIKDILERKVCYRELENNWNSINEYLKKRIDFFI